MAASSEKPGEWARGLRPPAAGGRLLPWLLIVFLSFLSFGVGAWLILANLQLAVVEAPDRPAGPAAEEGFLPGPAEPAGNSGAPGASGLPAGAETDEEFWTHEVR